MKIHKGDTVKIILGKDADKVAKVEKVFTKEGKVLVEGINQFKRHIKSRMQGQKSEIVTIVKPLPVTNVALLCPKCKQPTRVGYKMVKDGKVRVCRKCKHEFA